MVYDKDTKMARLISQVGQHNICQLFIVIVPHFFYREYTCFVNQQIAVINWRWGLENDVVLERRVDTSSPQFSLLYLIYIICINAKECDSKPRANFEARIQLDVQIFNRCYNIKY